MLPNFNHLNKEEPSRYVKLADCHYVIGNEDLNEARAKYSENDWSLVKSFPFLSPERSRNTLARYATADLLQFQEL